MEKNKPKEHIINYKITLLPCPFCNSDAEVKSTTGFGDNDFGKFTYDIRCTNKECYLQDGAEWGMESLDEIVALWNKRK